ncbi:MAG: AAA family ATPase [Coprobacillus sp.]|nr:AAA family ATPase [Coprobacillus sp.]
MASLKESAIQYAKANIRVFPLAPNSKSGQVLRSWKKEATTDIEKIKKWWNTNPNYNIGIATGEGLLVVDVDVKHEAKGIESFDIYGEHLPITAKVKTPSGGYHFYYYVEGDFKNRVNIYPGIDIRANNGYVVAPPSVIDGKCYEWVNNESVATADGFVYGFLSGPVEKENTPLHMEDEITQGQRNDILFKLASSLQSKGLDDKAILSALWQENKAKCSPPLTKEEVKAIYQNVVNRYDKGTASYQEPKKNLSLEMISMADVEERDQEWLIRDFIPKGTITIIGGDGGAGKTTVWCDIVASISSGTYTFFENEDYSLIEKREPQKVMFFSSEDDMNTTLKKRLRLNGANMDNIITVPMEDERFQNIKYNSDFLRNIVYEHKPTLLVFDPLQGFLPNNVNMGYRNQMRNTLNPLLAYGADIGVTTLIICHTNKKSDVSARGRISDSSDIWDIARNVFVIGHTGENDIRYLSHEKCNVARLQDTTLFTIEDGIVTFRGTTKKKDRDFMSKKSYDRKGKGAKDEAKEFILDQLKEHGGTMENKELSELALATGYSKSNFDKVRAELSRKGLIEIKPTGKGEDRVYNISLIPIEG